MSSTITPGRQFTIFKNSVATSLTCTIIGGNLSANDTINTVSFVAGDVIAIGVIDTAIGGTTRNCYVSCLYTF